MVLPRLAAASAAVLVLLLGAVAVPAHADEVGEPDAPTHTVTWTPPPTGTLLADTAEQMEFCVTAAAGHEDPPGTRLDLGFRVEEIITRPGGRPILRNRPLEISLPLSDSVDGCATIAVRDLLASAAPGTLVFSPFLTVRSGEPQYVEDAGPEGGFTLELAVRTPTLRALHGHYHTGGPVDLEVRSAGMLLSGTDVRWEVSLAGAAFQDLAECRGVNPCSLRAAPRWHGAAVRAVVVAGPAAGAQSAASVIVVDDHIAVEGLDVHDEGSGLWVAGATRELHAHSGVEMARVVWEVSADGADFEPAGEGEELLLTIPAGARIEVRALGLDADGVTLARGSLVVEGGVVVGGAHDDDHAQDDDHAHDADGAAGPAVSGPSGIGVADRAAPPTPGPARTPAAAAPARGLLAQTGIDGVQALWSAGLASALLAAGALALTVRRRRTQGSAGGSRSVADTA